MKASSIVLSRSSNPQATELPSVQTAKPTKGKFDQLLHSINELLQNNVLSTELPIKKHPRLIDMQRLLTLQDEVQRVHLGVEIISRVNESVLSITKKVQNG